MVSVVCLILCGGMGSRLWPLSNKDCPKQLVRLVSNHSLLQETVLRVADQEYIEEIVLLCNRRFISQIDMQMVELNIDSPIRFLEEPIARGTAIPILALSHIYPPDTNFLVLSCDNLFDKPLFNQLVINQLTNINDKINLIGAKPTYPETGYAYIGYDTDNIITNFKEKPDEATAQTFIHHGYLWHTGTFIFTVKTFQNIFNHTHPNVFDITRNMCNKDLKLNVSLYDTLPIIGMERGLLERNIDKLMVIPYDGLWTDLGTWLSVSDVSAKDKDGNTVMGRAKLENCTNCYVNNTSSDTVALVGMDNCVVVKDKDNILVLNKSYSQEVKRIMEN